MPKNIFKDGKFDGGINSNHDPKDIADNEVSDASDAFFGKPGQIGNIGFAKPTNDINILPVGATSGYGLAAFDASRSFSAPSAGNYWGDSAISETVGNNGVEPWFEIRIHDIPQDNHFKNDLGFPIVPDRYEDIQVQWDLWDEVIDSGGSEPPPGTYLSSFPYEIAPKKVCEDWGLRIHVGAVVGTPQYSFPTGMDTGSGTIESDAISYRIVEDSEGISDAELITNDKNQIFDEASDWLEYSPDGTGASVTLGDDASPENLEITGSASATAREGAYLPVGDLTTPVVGTTYRISADMWWEGSDPGTGEIFYFSYGGKESEAFDLTATSAGTTYTIDITAVDTTSAFRIYKVGNTTAQWNIDNVSVKLAPTKWFGLLPQNTVCRYRTGAYGGLNGGGTPTYQDAAYFFRMREYGQSGTGHDQGGWTTSQMLFWDVIWDENIPGGTSATLERPTFASGYGSNGKSNFLKALALMIGKHDEFTTQLLGTDENWTSILVRANYSAYSTYTPTNKYIWVEYRYYGDIDKGGEDPENIFRVSNNVPTVSRTEENGVFNEGTAEYNFLNIPQMFDTDLLHGAHSTHYADYYGISASDAFQRPEFSSVEGNAHVQDLNCAGYYYPHTGSGYQAPYNKTARRLLPGPTSQHHSYQISLLETDGGNDTTSGETYGFRISGPSVVETAGYKDISQAHGSDGVSTCSAAITQLVSKITGTYGSDIVTHGDMSSSINWVEAGSWEVVGGVATTTSPTSSKIYQDLGSDLEVNEWYQIIADVSFYQGGVLKIALGQNYDLPATNDDAEWNGVPCGWGTEAFTRITRDAQIFYVKAPSSMSNKYIEFYGPSFHGKVDNVSVKKVTAGIGGLTASASTQSITITSTGTSAEFSYNIEPYITRAAFFEFDETPTENILFIDSTSDLWACDSSTGVWNNSLNHTSSSNTKLYWANSGAKPQFYSNSAIMRFADTNFDNTSNKASWLGYIHKADLFNQTGSGSSNYDIEGWFVKDQHKTITAGWTRTRWDLDINSAPGNELEIYLYNTADTTGTWDHETFKFYLTAWYDDDSESLPSFTDADGLNYKNNAGAYTLDMGVVDGTADDFISLRVAIDPDNSGFTFDERMKGFRIYYASNKDSYGEIWELATIDFKKGLIRGDGGGTIPWTGAGLSNYDCQTAVTTFEDQFQTNRYIDNTGYHHRNLVNHVEWKTAVVCNGRCIVGNIQYDDGTGSKRYPSMMCASPVGMLDTFLVPDGLLIFGEDRGDEIIKLETYADRLLQYNKNSLSIINMAELDSEFLEEEHRWKGVSSPNHVVWTPLGIIWANKYSVYKYDGDEVSDLMMPAKGDFEGSRRISRTTWDTFFSETSLLIYEPKDNQIIVKRSSTGNASQNNGDIYLLDLDNGGWSFGKNRFVSHSASQSAYDTNAVTLFNGDIYLLNSKSVVINERSIKTNSGVIDEGGETLL